MTPREFLLALVLLGIICAIIGAVRLMSAVWRFLRRDLMGAFAPLEAKLLQTMAAIEASAGRIATLDALATRAGRAALTIRASRAGVARAGIALRGSFHTLGAEWRRLRGTFG